MTESVSVVCQNLVLVYNVLSFSVFYVVLPTEVEAGEDILQHSADAVRHGYTDTDPEYH